MATSPTMGASGDEVGRRTFSTSFRGFDQGEVRAYLEVVAAEFAALQARVAELESQLEEASRPAELPSLDAATLTGLVGEETARVLRAAQEAADDLRTRAEEGAARTLTEAHEEAARLRGTSETVLAERTAEAEKSAAAIRSDAQDKADKLLRDSKAEADRITHDAVEQGRDMVGQAQAARERVLGDLARRRRAALAQIEQLRAGRERLENSLHNVRAELDRIHQDLAAADEAARQAAEVASRSDRPKEASAAAGPAEEATAEQPVVVGAGSSSDAAVQIRAEAEPTPPPEAEPQSQPPPEAEPQPQPPPEAEPQPEPQPQPDSEPQPEPEPLPKVEPEARPSASSESESESAAAAAAAAEPVPSEAAPELAPTAGAASEPEGTAASAADVSDPADGTDRTTDAVQAEEALISAPPRASRRPKATVSAPTATPPAPRPTYAHDPVPAAILPTAIVGAPEPAAPGAVDAEPEAPPAKVDELFARIRADRAATTEVARATLAAGPASPGPASTGPGSPGPAATGPASTGLKESGADGAANAGEPDPAKRRKRAATANHPSAGETASAGMGASAREDSALEAPRTDAEETYLQRRDVLVEVVQATTVRALRRSLADDQNAALDKFRTVRADTVEVGALLGDEQSQVRSWSRRAAPGLIDGAAAGAHLASGGSAPVPDADLVGPIADRLAAELVGPLRGRLAGVLEAVGRDRGSDTVDRINSVFREWRSRIERTVGDAVTEAVSAGFVASVGAGSPVAWVVEDLDGPCPDCDDNALAGSTPLGEPFPTGQTAPPAHPGCRCVLTRTPA